MDKLESKRNNEKKIVQQMIELYCRKKHGTNCLCDECKEILDYAILRINKCPFMETKTFCNNCKVHCYKADKRKKIKRIMKYSGPRMIFVNPIMVMKHMILSVIEKRKQ